MRRIKSSILLVASISTLVGCSTFSEADYAQVIDNKVTLTGGFDFTTMRGSDKHGYLTGDEFLASFELPPGTWTYAAYLQSINRGKIRLSAPNYYGMDIQWLWLDAINKKQRLEGEKAQAPWYTGVRDTTFKRIPYTPTQEQLKSGDWNESGYKRSLWHQYRLLGKKQLYCYTSLSTRSNNTAWNAENGVPIGNSYGYSLLCPFRFTDGRDGDFIIRTGFFIESTNTQNKAQSNAQDNQAQIEAKLAEIDAQLKPIWDSLQVNPKAYQFNINKE